MDNGTHTQNQYSRVNGGNNLISRNYTTAKRFHNTNVDHCTIGGCPSA